MSFSYQFGANPSIDYVRLLIGDTQQFLADGVTTGYIFEDAEITAAGAMSAFGIISPNSGRGLTTTSSAASPRFVAATLLRALANNRARLAGVKKLLDVELDVSTMAKSLTDQACALEDQERNSGAAAIVEQVGNAFQARERLEKQAWRLFGA